MLQRYLDDQTPSGQAELDVADAVFVNSTKSMSGVPSCPRHAFFSRFLDLLVRCMHVGLFDLCNKLGLDYSEEDIQDSGDVYVAKYNEKDPQCTARRKRRFLEYLQKVATRSVVLHEMRMLVQNSERRSESGDLQTNAHVLSHRQTENAQAADTARLREKSDQCDARVNVKQPGFRRRFYMEKLAAHGTDAGGNGSAASTPQDLQRRVRDLCAAYVEGLQWVLSYYHSGCAAWDWFYPDHYAPFALDVAAYLRCAWFAIYTNFPPCMLNISFLVYLAVRAASESLNSSSGSHYDRSSSSSPFCHLQAPRDCCRLSSLRW